MDASDSNPATDPDVDALLDAETSAAPGADGSTWTDFGVGLAHLDLPALLADQVQHRNPRHVVDVEPASSCRSHTPAGTGRLSVGPGVVRVTR